MGNSGNEDRRGHGNDSRRTKHGSQGLSGIEELGRRDGIVLLGIDRDIDKGTLEGREQGGSLGYDGSGHADWGYSN